MANQGFLLSIMATGFVVAFAHAAIPTHWLPFVLAGRGQGWSKSKTLWVVALCGLGHVLFTTALGVLLVWFGIETSKWVGTVFPWIAGGALIAFGLYYLARQARGEGHGHSHFGGGHSHDHDHSHDHSAGHSDETKRIDTGHGVLLLEVFETGVPPRFRVRVEDASMRLPTPDGLTIETLRPDGARQKFSMALKDSYLESVEDIPEPHQFEAIVVLSHGDHAHRHKATFEEHHDHGACDHGAKPSAATATPARSATAKSDRAVILGLFTLLTFSPCEGFLPVYLSGIAYGWGGFIMLSLVLALATIAGMLVFTWLTLAGFEHLRLGFLEKYESGILGALILFLGAGIIFLGF